MSLVTKFPNCNLLTALRNYSWSLLLSSLSLLYLYKSSHASFIKVINNTKASGEIYVNKKPIIRVIRICYITYQLSVVGRIMKYKLRGRIG
jgi:hypothetical protein